MEHQDQKHNLEHLQSMVRDVMIALSELHSELAEVKMQLKQVEHQNGELKHDLKAALRKATIIENHIVLGHSPRHDQGHHEE